MGLTVSSVAVARFAGGLSSALILVAVGLQKQSETNEAQGKNLRSDGRGSDTTTKRNVRAKNRHLATLPTDTPEMGTPVPGRKHVGH